MRRYKTFSIQDGTTGEILIVIDSSIINDIDTIKSIVGNLFFNISYLEEHDYLIKVGYRPISLDDKLY